MWKQSPLPGFYYIKYKKRRVGFYEEIPVMVLQK